MGTDRKCWSRRVQTWLLPLPQFPLLHHGKGWRGREKRGMGEGMGRGKAGAEPQGLGGSQGKWVKKGEVVRDPELGGGQGGAPTAGERGGFPECGETGSSSIPAPTDTAGPGPGPPAPPHLPRSEGLCWNQQAARLFLPGGALHLPQSPRLQDGHSPGVLPRRETEVRGLLSPSPDRETEGQPKNLPP